MKERRVGNSGLFVSDLGLGTLTWGRDTDYEEARQQLELFSDAGGTLIDTAASYGEGESETLLGELLRDTFNRQDYVLSTKAGIYTNNRGHSQVNASRTTLLNTLDASLKRLGTDYIDIFFIHHYDYTTPIDESISALEYAVNSGRVRYLGVSNYPSWALAEIATILKNKSLSLTVAQNEYSLANRSAEKELLTATNHFRSGFFAWSPLGRGVLTGKYRNSLPPDSRAASSHLQGFIKPYLDEKYFGLLDAISAAAEGLGWLPLEVALAWVKDAPQVTSILTGARTATQLSAILSGSEKVLPHQIRKALDDISESL